MGKAVFPLEPKRLDIRLASPLPKGGFVCPQCGQADLKVYDTTEKSRRHLSFFRYEAWLTAKVPRVKCDHCGVKQVASLWVCPGSGCRAFSDCIFSPVLQ